MNNPFQTQAKVKPKLYTNDSILEALRSVGGGVTQAVGKDVMGKGTSDVLAALLGQTPKTSGELQENQAINFRKPEHKAAPAPIRREEAPRQSLSDLDTMKVKGELAAVRQELKALSDSIKAFHQEVQKAVSDVPVNPGVYHVNFLERLRSILKILREQIEDSRTWLTLSTNRKQKKMYWGLYKKHGTKFGLSSERTLATQAG
ncbi:hypothetical protein HYV22_01725 [Candidatus Gottesmanbacteria bacterium]|nr:hypothetical protein [Candidatus Gottesmanbacteria bacterium]